MQFNVNFFLFPLRFLITGFQQCFRLGLVDCNPQLRNICIKEILGFRGDAVKISPKPMFLSCS